MIQEISRQAAEFFAAAGLGIFLGFFYDVGCLLYTSGAADD